MHVNRCNIITYTVKGLIVGPNTTHYTVQFCSRLKLMTNRMVWVKAHEMLKKIYWK